MKFLAKSPVSHQDGRPTLALDNWIIKLNDEDHPQIVLIEYFGMMVARAAGLPVQEVHLSEDRKHLLVKRCDLTAEGKRLGFEDMCALLGLPAREKFTGSVELEDPGADRHSRPMKQTIFVTLWSFLLGSILNIYKLTVRFSLNYF